jgi:hypothetical protein
MIEKIDLEEYVKQVGNCWGFETPDKNSPYYRIFREECKKADVEGVTLMMPEDMNNYPFDEVRHIGMCEGTKETGYTVVITTHPQGVEYAHPRWRRDNRYDIWASHPLIFFEQVLAHELGHIRNGDCDRAIKWPRWMLLLAYPFLEFAASAYESSRLNEIQEEGLTF